MKYFSYFFFSTYYLKKVKHRMYNTYMIVSSLSAYHSSEHLLKEEVFLLKDLPFTQHSFIFLSHP